VRLITDDNENIGVVSLHKALDLAAERGLDLVEVKSAKHASSKNKSKSKRSG